jgi:hypothetical protein
LSQLLDPGCGSFLKVACWILSFGTPPSCCEKFKWQAETTGNNLGSSFS